MRVHQLGVQMCVPQSIQHRLRYKTDEPLGKIDPNKCSDADCVKRIYDALAELRQMLKERHLRAGCFHPGRDGVVRLAAAGHEKERFGWSPAPPRLPFPAAKRLNGG